MQKRCQVPPGWHDVRKWNEMMTKNRAVPVAIFSIAMLFTCGMAVAQDVRPQVVARDLQNPWAVAFLPEGRFLVAERPGRMRVVEADGRVQPPLTGLPAVAAGGQGGLRDVVLDSDFASNHTLYFCCKIGEGLTAKAGLARQSVRGFAEVRLPGPHRIGPALQGPGAARTQAACRWRRAHPWCAPGPGRAALCADRRVAWPVAAAVAWGLRYASRRSSRCFVPALLD